MAPPASCLRLSLAACAVALALSAPAEAAETRYVASYGSNSNNCTLNAPCRTLQRAVNQAPDNGEVIVLDSGHFGNSLTITKSITISADSVTATLGDPGGITIDNADAVVVLRGLHLKGAGAFGVSGIRIDNAASVHIERCTIERFSIDGIKLLANADAELFVTDSISRNNGQSGLWVQTGNRGLTVDNSRFEYNPIHGLLVQSAESTVTRSIASGNGNTGIWLGSGARMNATWTMAANNRLDGYHASDSKLTLESSVASGNGANGLYVRNESRARVSRSVFSHNSTGIRIEAGSTVQTYETSVHRGNGTNLANSGTIATPAPF